MHVTTADHALAAPAAETFPPFCRRGGPLLDFISANFLFILLTVAVVGVAAGAFLAYERSTYASGMRVIQTTITQHAANNGLRTLTPRVLRELLPTTMDIDNASIVWFGGVMAEGLPLRIYRGGPTTGTGAAHFPLYSADTERRMILLVGDATYPANEAASVCEDLAKIQGPGVSTIQIRTAPGTALAPAAAATSTPAARDGTRYATVEATPDVLAASDNNTWAGTGTTADSITFTRRARGATTPASFAIADLPREPEVGNACAADQAIAIAYVLGS